MGILGGIIFSITTRLGFNRRDMIDFQLSVTCNHIHLSGPWGSRLEKASHKTIPYLLFLTQILCGMTFLI